MVIMRSLDDYALKDFATFRFQEKVVVGLLMSGAKARQPSIEVGNCYNMEVQHADFLSTEQNHCDKGLMLVQSPCSRISKLIFFS